MLITKETIFKEVNPAPLTDATLVVAADTGWREARSVRPALSKIPELSLLKGLKIGPIQTGVIRKVFPLLLFIFSGWLALVLRVPTPQFRGTPTLKVEEPKWCLF